MSCMSEPPGLCLGIRADLVFDDGIPEVICKIRYGGHVPFLLRVLARTGGLR